MTAPELKDREDDPMKTLSGTAVQPATAKEVVEDDAFCAKLVDRALLHGPDPLTPRPRATPIANSTRPPQKQFPSSMRQEALKQAVTAWAGSDPKAALAYAESLPDAAMRRSALESTLRQWMESEPLEVIDYLNASTDEEFKKNQRYLITNFANDLGAKERAELLKRLPAGKLRYGVMESLSGNFIRKGNYNDAMEMLNDMPDSTGRDENVLALGLQWAKTDPAAAGEWLKNLPESTDRDLAVTGYVRILARSDPQSAIQWANQIPDARIKQTALQNIALGWMRSDPAAAEPWMKSIPGIKDYELTNLRNWAKDDYDHSGPSLPSLKPDQRR